MPREPLLLPAISLAGGILSAHLMGFPLNRLPLFLAVALLATMAAFAYAGLKSWRLPAWCLLFFLAGGATEVAHRPGPAPKLNLEDGEAALLSGCIVNPPVFSPGRAQFTLELAPGKSIRLSTVLHEGQELPPLSYGQSVEAAAKIRYPRNFQNPDAFDYVGYLAQQKIYWTGSVSGPADVHLQPGHCGSRALSWLYAIRTWALGRLAALYPNDQHTTGLLQATLLGETAGVERRWTTDFRITGTYHALVISGQHVAVLAGTLIFLLGLLQLRRLHALVIATSATWMYAFLSGLSSPVVRAAGGFTIFLIASLFFRKTRILNVLGAIGILYLLFAPEELFDPSFQLSFLSAAAIAAFAIPLMERWTHPLRASVKRFDQVAYDPKVEVRAAEWRVELRLLAETVHAWTTLPLAKSQWLVARCAILAAWMADAVIVSACVQFGLALPMISYFHRLSITGFSANILVIPLLSAVVPLGFAALLTGWHPVAWATAVLLHWSEAIASWHARFEPAYRMAALPVGLSIAFALALIVLAVAVRRGNRFATTGGLACSLALFGAICWQPWKPLLKSGWLEVTAIDVNQGDSLLVSFPEGKTMLVDAGGFPGLERMARKPQVDMGEDVVSPYLWSRRIRHLDYVAISHGHSDHMAGMPAILDNFQPSELWIGPEPDSEGWDSVRQHAAAAHVAIRSMRRGSPALSIGGAQVRVLAPEPDYMPEDHAGNDDSLVLEITYGKRSVLLEGDAEFPSEAAMVASGELRPVTLLKVGHHGSKTSSSEDLLTQVQPQYAIISDGFHNQFHHPHPITLSHLAAHNVSVFRTDQRGLIMFRTDGDQVEIRTFR